MIYSFGHSTLEQDAAVQILGEVDTVVDVRSHPTSRFSQWERSQLEAWLPERGYKYEWMPELGGWDTRHAPLADAMMAYSMDIGPYTQGFFPKGRISKKLDLPTPAWTVAGFWDFQWFMTLPEFHAGIQALIKAADGQDVAIMCAEFIPWSCHRSMVADYLLHFYDTDVEHLQPRCQKHSSWKSRMDRYDERAMRLMERNEGSNSGRQSGKQAL
jgi:hypothetical protein